MAVSIKTIARELSVNPSTVSRALSGVPGVSEEMRRKVHMAAERLGYVPDSHARDLRTQKRSGIAVICRAEPTAVSTLRNYAMLDIGRSALGRAHLIVRNPTESLPDVFGRALSERYAAVILNRPGGDVDPELLRRARGGGVAVVSIDEWREGVDNIVVERQVGTRQAARLFVAGGRRSIGLFSATGADSPDPRLDGFRCGFEELGRSLETAKLVRFEAASTERGFQLTRRLLRGERPDALFCYSDQMAVGAMRAAVEAGVPVGSDLWIVGFDDLVVSRFLSPSLTTVSQPIAGAARAAVQLLVARLADPEGPPVVRRFPTTLIIRESAPLPDGLSADDIYAR